MDDAASLDAEVPFNEDVGRLLEGYREYLLVIARDGLGPELRTKVGASDLVQETFLQAQRHLEQFRGHTHAELAAWLRAILESRLAKARRKYRDTEKRDVGREVSIDAPRDQVLGLTAALAGPAEESPSSHAVRREEAQALERALSRLPVHYRQILQWRHQDSRPFAEIAVLLACSPDAARQLWARAMQKLRREFDDLP